MNVNVHQQLNRRKRRILRRIKNQPGVESPTPMLAASNIHYGGAKGTSLLLIDV